MICKSEWHSILFSFLWQFIIFFQKQPAKEGNMEGGWENVPESILNSVVLIHNQLFGHWEPDGHTRKVSTVLHATYSSSSPLLIMNIGVCSCTA